MIQPQRVSPLNSLQPRSSGDYVVYWMQASQRAVENHALEYAVLQANALHKPLVVFFGLTASFPEANARHYQFMLKGLKETKAALQQRGIPLVIQQVSPEAGVVQLAKQASLVVVDRGYLRIQRQWRTSVAAQLRCPLIQVESDVVVPVQTTSQKEEYAAATIRPKIHKHLKTFLVPLRPAPLKRTRHRLEFDSIDLSNISRLVSTLPIHHDVTPSTVFQGGTSHALRLLKYFIRQKLSKFAELRNDPGKEYGSHMSPYLHFGQISPLTIALQIIATHDQNADAYLEELIVRRELSMNYVFYNLAYDSFESLPSWAQTTLHSHRKDPRPYRYTLEELEHAETHDPYWNAAQREMTTTGKMQGYMRMYWGKKIVEWSRSPQEAFELAVHLNNKYELDGRDPNGFTGVAWCFGKHDRPWQERQIFGKIRYMNDKGLTRKFDMEHYVEKIKSL